MILDVGALAVGVGKVASLWHCTILVLTIIHFINYLFHFQFHMFEGKERDDGQPPQCHSTDYKLSC